MTRGIFNYTRLLGAPSNLALRVSRQEPYRLPSLEGPQGPSSSTTQGRGEVCLFSLFLRLKQTYLLEDFHVCFWSLIVESCWWSAGFWILPPAVDLWTQACFESILPNAFQRRGVWRRESKKNFSFCLVSHCISFCSLLALTLMLVTAVFAYWGFFFFLLVSQIWFEVHPTWRLLLSLSYY